jgi:hypothetical protein
MWGPTWLSLVARIVSPTAMVVGIKARSAETFEHGLARAWLRRVEANALCSSERDPSAYIYRVETGSVALYKMLAGGRNRYNPQTPVRYSVLLTWAILSGEALQ